ncbi:MAG: porin, partial [Alphaproteobacteria bacterium]|nr:porin [Alphaproteobacteria bacterium]
SVKLNISHLLAPGLKPYVELHNYRLKGKPEFYSELKARKVKGIVALIGIKLTI